MGLVAAFKAAMAWVEDVCRANNCYLIFANCLPAAAAALPRLGFLEIQPQVFMTKSITA